MAGSCRLMLQVFTYSSKFMLFIISKATLRQFFVQPPTLQNKHKLSTWERFNFNFKCMIFLWIWTSKSTRGDDMYLNASCGGTEISKVLPWAQWPFSKLLTNNANPRHSQTQELFLLMFKISIMIACISIKSMKLYLIAGCDMGRIVHHSGKLSYTSHLVILSNCVMHYSHGIQHLLSVVSYRTCRSRVCVNLYAHRFGNLFLLDFDSVIELLLGFTDLRRARRKSVFITQCEAGAV